jgi:hypothetical protein
MEEHPGAYLGREMGERWWRRYRQAGFFARGSGKYWFEKDAFCFLRCLTGQPLRIPYRQIERIKTGKSHAGKWILGQPIVKVIWQAVDQVLSSGFAVPHGAEGAEKFIEALKKRLPASTSPSSIH